MLYPSNILYLGIVYAAYSILSRAIFVNILFSFPPIPLLFSRKYDSFLWGFTDEYYAAVDNV